MYTITLGTPEELVPSRYKPEGKTELTESCKFPSEKLSWKVTPRGITLEFPLGETEELLGGSDYPI